MNTSTPTRQYTPDDLLKLPDDGKRYELINGELAEKNMSWMSCKTGGKLFLRLGVHVEDNKLGVVFPQDSTFLFIEDGNANVRKPDVAFIAKARYTKEDETAEGHIHIVPDLVAEIVSPNDHTYDTDRKVEAYLRAGVKLVWIVRPERQIIEVNRADGTVTSLRAIDDLDGETVIPGFRCRVSQLFQE